MKKPPPQSRIHQKEPPYQSPPRPPPQQAPYQTQPPPTLHQQEPPYQSPPRPPPQQEPYQTQPPPPLRQREPSQARRPRRGPVITYIPAPKIINTTKENFKSLVQRLTGLPPPSSSPYTLAPNYTSSTAFDDSPAMGGGVDSQLPDLSPGPTSLWPELYSTTNPQDLEFIDSLSPSPSVADGYWNQQRNHQPPTSSFIHGDGGPLKRHRFDLGYDMHSYLSLDEDPGIPHPGHDYDTFLRRVQTPSLPPGEVGGFNGFGGMGRPSGANDTRAIGFGQQDLAGRPSRELIRLPPDASSTLFVEGLPSNCSMREVAHIFRRFSGYKEVRLVTTDSTQWNGDPIVLCFVDFEDPACAATARNELQGYIMDEEERDSKILQIQFWRNPDPRPGQRGGGR